MEQRWTNDRFDSPSGDLEFWAMRRGKTRSPADQNAYSTASRNRTIVGTGLAVLAIVAMGVAL
jgi:hypothetical protein